MTRNTKQKEMIADYQRLQDIDNKAVITLAAFIHNTSWGSSDVRQEFGTWKAFLEDVRVAEEAKADVEQGVTILFQNAWRSGDDFVFDFNNVPAIRGIVQITRSVLETMIGMYATIDGEGLTAVQIATELDIAPEIVRAILRRLEITHENFVSQDLDTLFAESGEGSEHTEKLMEGIRKRKTLRAQMRNTLETESKKDAESWRAFRNRALDPFKEALEGWKPQLNPVRRNKHINRGGTRKLVVTLSDLHFGKRVKPGETFQGVTFSFVDTRKKQEEYLAWIEREVLSGNYDTSSCTLLSLGDIVDSLSGFTDKGTKLESSPVGSAQWAAALDSLLFFYEGLYAIFERVETHAVGGNHDHTGDSTLLEALHRVLCAGGLAKSSDFHVYQEKWGSCLVDDTYIIFEHGYSSKYKAKLPKAKSAREAYILSLLQRDPKAQKAKKHVFVCGDQHHTESLELAHVEFVMTATINESDKYESENNFASRPSQTVLAFDSESFAIIKKFF